MILVVVQESQREIRDGETVAIGVDAALTWTLARECHQTIEEGQEELFDWSLRSRANAVVVAQVLGVGLIAQLVLGKHTAPAAEAAGNLTLVPAQIEEEENVGVVEGEVAARQSQCA